MTSVKIICTIVYIILMLGTFLTVGNAEQYFDVASLFVVIVIALLYSLAARGDSTYIQKFGDGAVRAGWLGTIIGVVAIFGSDWFSDGNLMGIGASFAVASLTLLYGYMIKLGTLILD